MKCCIYVILFVTMIWQVASECDDSIDTTIEEGNLGQSGTFSWLGILRVHVHNNEKLQIALTGLVLITRHYALVNADDVVKIPPKLFKDDSRVMFLASTDTPWYCPPKSFKTHHEYEYKTVNTIGLLELDLDDIMDYPMRPVCFTNLMSFNTSTFLYVTGYTDENHLLEKVIYKVQYTEKKACEDFYNRSGLADPMNKPTNYLCGYSTFKTRQCTWDNGMALVTNVTENFSLIGFAIRGPGCAAPARFIDMQHYYEWVEDSVSPKQEMDYLEYQK